MAQSQRVLSGSLTKGSNATPSGSIIYSYQGVNARTDASYFGSLLPRIGSGNRTKIYKSTKPLSDTEYDDSLTINDDTSDMGGEDDPRITTRISFDLERLAFGQPSTSQQGSMFADINRFDPVQYVNDPGEFMWPVNLWNLGQLPNHEFDGVVEVFDIRREVLGYMDLRYEGRTFRGSLTGPFSETPFGSTKITDKIQLVDFAPTPFFDGPNQMSHDRGTDIPVLARMSFMAHSASWTDPGSAMAFPGYQGLEIEKDAPVVAQDYHDIVYGSLNSHNPPTQRIKAQYDLNLTWSIGENKYTSGGSLVGWWRLTKDVATAGVVPDSSLNSFTGSFPGGSGTRPTFAQFTPSDRIQKMSGDFDGTDDFVYVGDSPTKSWNSLVGGSEASGDLKAFTISFWVYITTDDSLNEVVSISSQADASAVRVGIGNAGRLYLRRSNEYNFSYGAPGPVTEDAWHHVVAVYSGVWDGVTTPWTVYVDTAVIPLTYYSQITPTDFADDVQLRIAARKSSGQIAASYFDGTLADVALWSTALSAADVNTLYEATAGALGVNTLTDASDMTEALRLLNSSSCNSLTDPMDIHANHGFYFGQKAGSIVYGDW